MKRSLLLLFGGILYLTLSGFQCASTQVSSAKVALRGKDFAKAETALKEEVSLRPNNSEAWYLLGSGVYSPQQRWADMNHAFLQALKATEPPLSESDRRNVALYMLRPSLAAAGNASAAAQKNDFKSALAYIDTAITVRSDLALNYVQKAYFLSRLGEDQKMISTYSDYVSNFGSDIKKGVEKGLALGMSESQVQAKLGEPIRKSGVDPEVGTFAWTYADNMYVYFGPAKSGKGNIVDGWMYFKEPSLPEEFKTFSRSLNGYPMYRLAVEAYGQKNYDRALELLQQLEQFDPEREDVGNLIAQVYIDANRVDEARAILEKRMVEDPNNPKIYINYSILLHNAKNYQAATDILVKVLDLKLADDNPSLHTALYNLGVFYKNWGKHLQDSLDEATKGKPSANQQNMFVSKLRESVKYFERLWSVQKEDVDYGLLAELGNLYYVLAEDGELKKILTAFEALQKKPEVQQDGQYWRELSKLYSGLQDVEKATEAGNKARALGY